MAGLTYKQRIKMTQGRYGETFRRVVLLAASGAYRSRAEIAREVGVTRARVKQILETADVRGILEMPFERYPKRSAGLDRRRGLGL
jgi:hypothetical protein